LIAKATLSGDEEYMCFSGHDDFDRLDEAEGERKKVGRGLKAQPKQTRNAAPSLCRIQLSFIHHSTKYLTTQKPFFQTI
jgi:hypothetical protein